MTHKFLTSLMVSLLALSAHAQTWGETITGLNPSDQWTYGTIEGTVNVKLTGTISMSGTLVISNGAVLNISIAESATDDIMICPSSGFVGKGFRTSGTCMFMVEEGGTLNIKGASGHLITIRGTETGNANIYAANIDSNGYLTSLTDSPVACPLKESAISAVGNVNLQYVRISDVVIDNDKGGAILIPDRTESNMNRYSKYGAVTVNDSEILSCKSKEGPALLVCAKESSANAPSDCPVLFENVKIQHCHVTEASDGNGGIIRTYGGCISPITLKKVTITQNLADGCGGGIFWNGLGEGTSLILDGCTFTYNHSTQDGGAMILEGAFSFEGGRTTIANNKADGNGGGICLKSYSGNATTTDDITMALNRISIECNSAARGGGLACLFQKTTLSNLTLNTDISGTSLSSNTATDGGGIYYASELATSTGLNLNINVKENSTLSANHASRNGGAIFCTYSSGTIKPSLSFSGAKVADNKAGNFGGALYIESGCSCTVTDGEITSNTAVWGGAFGIFTGAVINIDGGNISLNSATHGGAIYAHNGSKCYVNGGNIISNTARNGGGIFLNGTNTAMTYSNGIIRNNEASGTQSTMTTGYNLTPGYLYGAGGGICITGGASMNFDAGSVGIYGNAATLLGDDIFANGNNTAVTLPDVSSMNLSGYNSKTSDLFWVEDYMNGDTGYQYGTYGGGNGYSPTRYRTSIANQSSVYPIDPTALTSIKNRYLALALGYEILHVTIKATGLKAGESAIYRISHVEGNSISQYATIILTGTASAETVSKKIALFSGAWKVEDLGWNWTQTPTSDSIKQIAISSASDAEAKTVSFTYNDKAQTPKHAEGIVVNKF